MAVPAVARNTIQLKGRGITKEATAGGTVTPGDLIKIDSASKYIRHNVAGGAASLLFALENELFGKEITVDYSSSAPADVVKAMACTSGMEVYATLAANAPAIVCGDYLESAGDGTLRKVTSQPADLTDSTAGTANTTLEALPNPTDTPASADALRDDLVAVLIPALRNNFADLAAALNALTPGGVGNPIAVALEDYDNSAVAAKAHIRVELI